MRHCFSIDGPLLERWFLKTAINTVMLIGRTRAWAMSAPAGAPPLELVQMAHGNCAIEKPFGLYSLASVGQSIDSKDHVSCHPLAVADGSVAAALFEFRGLSFLLNMQPLAPSDVRLAHDRDKILKPSDNYLYHLNRVNCDVQGERSHFLDFNWPDSKFDHFSR